MNSWVTLGIDFLFLILYSGIFKINCIVYIRGLQSDTAGYRYTMKRLPWRSQLAYHHLTVTFCDTSSCDPFV